MADMTTFDNIWTRLGGRKLIAMVLGVGTTILLAFFDKLDGNAVTAILGLTAAFAGGNAVEHIIHGLKQRPVPENSPSEEIEPENLD